MLMGVGGTTMYSGENINACSRSATATARRKGRGEGEEGGERKRETAQPALSDHRRRLESVQWSLPLRVPASDATSRSRFIWFHAHSSSTGQTTLMPTLQYMASGQLARECVHACHPRRLSSTSGTPRRSLRIRCFPLRRRSPCPSVAPFSERRRRPVGSRASRTHRSSGLRPQYAATLRRVLYSTRRPKSLSPHTHVSPVLIADTRAATTAMTCSINPMEIV